eukprot:7986417-Pyramimonas_sp.AAC.1
MGDTTENDAPAATQEEKPTVDDAPKPKRLKVACKYEGCTKSIAHGGLPLCISHGGGRRCQLEGCTKAAESGGAPY